MDNFQELHKHALIIATKMLASLDDTQRQFVDGAVAGGARVILEVGPLPGAERVVVALVEREGRRVDVCAMTSSPATIQ